MYFDRFDICEAWYLYLSHYHPGQWSPEYARLSRLLCFFSPADSLRAVGDLSDNGREIYRTLEEGGIS